MRDARPQCHIPVAVTYGKAKAHRIVVVPDYIADDLFRSRAERPDRVFAVCKAADHQPGEPVEAAAPLKLAGHFVYVIEICSYIFDKKDLSGRRHRRSRAGDVSQQGQVAARDRRADLTGPVEGV